MKNKLSIAINFIKKNLKKISSWNINLSNKWKFRSLLMFLVLLFTTFNNYYFYQYVGHSVKKDATQLKLILNGDLQYFRTHKISGKNYRAHTKILVEQFSKKAQYNKSITLNYLDALKKDGKYKKGYESFEHKKGYDKVTQSVISIVVPKLNTNEPLKYSSNIKVVGWFEKEFLLSVFRSMTLSIFDVNHYIEGNHKGFLKKNLKKDLIKNFEKYRTEITFSNTLKTVWNKWRYEYFPRSRNPLVFLFVLFFLFLRIRKYQIELYKKNAELTTENSDLTTKIGELETKLEGNENQDIKKIMKCIKSRKNDELKILIKNGIDIDTKNSAGMTALMLYMLTDETEQDKREVIKIFLDNGADINKRNAIRMTTLMLCLQDEKLESAEILLDNGADMDLEIIGNAEIFAKSKAGKDLLNQRKNHSPKKLLAILKNFTNEPIKWSAHDWRLGELKDYNTFSQVTKAIKKQFDTIENDLKELSPNLYNKIRTFLFNIESDDQSGWCVNKNVPNINWANLEGLEEYCNSNPKNYAFDFELTDAIFVNDDDGDINTFGGIVQLFKQEIEMRTDFSNNLEDLFSEKQEELLDYGFNIDISNSNLKRQFYTDTQHFTNAINKIFNAIKDRKKYKNIEILTQDKEDRSIEIIITHEDSYSTRSAEELLTRAKTAGDIFEIKKNLEHLCDWSIESNYKNHNFRINILHSENVDSIITLENKPKGYTHILRFYR